MSNLSSIARPYALAAFEYARNKQQLIEWKSFLDAAAYAVKQSEITRIIANPEISFAKLETFFAEVLDKVLDPARKNFLALLVQNRRLTALPEIADAFNLYCAALEKITKIRVITAIQAESVFQQKLEQALMRRMQQEVALQYEIDPAILGGAIIHIGDRVIDGSIRGKLTRLLQNLTA